MKYVVGGGIEKQIDPSIVSIHQELPRTGRKRRGREFLMTRAQDLVEKLTNTNKKVHKKRQAPKKKKKPSTSPPESALSPDPTSPSTPVTPEHKPPPASKRLKVAATTTTTASSSSSSSVVPSYIIANQAMEVSPLDRSCAKQEAPKPFAIAKRGLFQVTTTTTTTTTTVEPNKANLKKKKPTPIFSAASSSDKKADIQKAVAPKQPILQFPRPKPTATIQNGNRKPLKEVYDKDCQKAKKFVSQVVGARSDDVLNSEPPKNKPTIAEQQKPAALS